MRRRGYISEVNLDALADICAGVTWPYPDQPPKDAAARRLLDALGVVGVPEAAVVAVAAHAAMATTDCAHGLCTSDAVAGGEFCGVHGAHGKTRAEKVAAIAQMRSAYPELTDAQRAEALGMTLSAYRNLVNDPDGSKQRARREGYKGQCVDCGAETRANGTSRPSPRCPACAVEHARVWDAAAIVAAFHEFVRVTGRVPATTDALGARAPSILAKLGPERRHETLTHGVRLPAPGTVTAVFGSWPNAVRAAGLEPLKTGGAAHRGRSAMKPCKTPGCANPANTRYDRGMLAGLCEETCMPQRREQISKDNAARSAKRKDRTAPAAAAVVADEPASRSANTDTIADLLSRRNELQQEHDRWDELCVQAAGKRDAIGEILQALQTFEAFL